VSTRPGLRVIASLTTWGVDVRSGPFLFDADSSATPGCPERDLITRCGLRLLDKGDWGIRSVFLSTQLLQQPLGLLSRQRLADHGLRHALDDVAIELVALDVSALDKLE
jgi:hypothetical protein